MNLQAGLVGSEVFMLDAQDQPKSSLASQFRTAWKDPRFKILVVLLYLVCGTSICRRILARPLNWPQIAVINLRDATVFRSDEHRLSFTPIKNGLGILFAGEGSSQMRLNSNSYRGADVFVGGKMVWSGDVIDFSHADDQLAVVTWAKDSKNNDVETVVINLKTGSKGVTPRCWMSIFKGGSVLAQRNPATLTITISLLRDSKVMRGVSTSLKTLDELGGLDSDGENIAYTEAHQLHFIGKDGSWTKHPGLLHDYRRIKVVNSYSCVAECYSESGLVGADFHAELVSQYATDISPVCEPDYLILGDDARHLVESLTSKPSK